MSTPEDFTPDYVQGYLDGMNRASQIATTEAQKYARVTGPAQRTAVAVSVVLADLSTALRRGASVALAVGTAQHAEAPLPTPVLFDKVRVTSPRCQHKGVGTLIKIEGRIDHETGEQVVTAMVVFDDRSGTWFGPISAVVPA